MLSSLMFASALQLKFESHEQGLSLHRRQFLFLKDPENHQLPGWEGVRHI